MEEIIRKTVMDTGPESNEDAARSPEGNFFIWKNIIGGKERTFVQIIKSSGHKYNSLYLVEGGRPYVKIPSSLIKPGSEEKKESVLPAFFVFSNYGQNLAVCEGGLYNTSRNYGCLKNQQLPPRVLCLATNLMGNLPSDKALEGTFFEGDSPVDFDTLQMLDWGKLVREIEKGYVDGGKERLNAGTLEFGEGKAAVLTPNGRFVHLNGEFRYRHGEKLENGAFTYVITDPERRKDLNNRFTIEKAKVVKGRSE